jgi:hypothetical protein
MPMKSSRRFLNSKKSHAMTVIEIRPYRSGWQVYGSEQTALSAICSVRFGSGHQKIQASMLKRGGTWI